ncbi:DNA polymerase III subunit epsilon [Maioricimonas rarisocia]|uniref:DNA polymerase III subunit epsilon n=1 Tax=Maioricimonas rarisocia TaxID=2528026 RepID=A0A517Z286_9PLAN|nr:tetratricopeptide repeat protein [Maioricimonas rarisocia]QDU36577.1 DNA polymerase III subunit epsilon [Maioricimonas rarisocia]
MADPPPQSEHPSPVRSSPSLQGERVAFTGTLASMTHAKAAELVAEHGGTSTDHVSRQTTMLVVGEEGWPLDDDGQPSLKIRQAERWIEEGAPLRIINESDWLHLLGLTERCDEIHRLYTPAMLSSLLGISVHLVRTWERCGLIRPVRKTYRLPYFDFAEVNCVRRLNELLDAGVSRRELESSLRSLPSVRRGDERPLEQLDLLVRNSHIVVRDDHGLIVPTSGQRLLDFSIPDESEPAEVPSPESEARPPSVRFRPAEPEHETWSSGDWFSQGCLLSECGELKAACEAFRLCLMTDAQNAEAHFRLAECLYRLDNVPGALERYHAAVENDHGYLEAWTQIGSLHRELGELDAAVDAFDIALDIHPDYPDAHFQKAETLAELGRMDEAAPHWLRYLDYDVRGPWADVARQRLQDVPADVAGLSRP